MRNISYSQYSMFHSCKHQWKLNYIDGLKTKDSSIELIFGTAIHETVQEWLFIHYNDEKMKANVYDMVGRFRAKLMELFRTNFVTHEDGTQHPICDRPTFEEYYLDGKAILDWIKAHKNDIFPASGMILVGTEIPLNVKVTEGVTFVGFIDMVVRNRKTKDYVLYDFKTSKKGWYFQKKDYKKTDQLLLYKKFFADMESIELNAISVEFMILKRKLGQSAFDKRVTTFEPSNALPSINKTMKRFYEFIDNFDEEGNVKNMDALAPSPSESSCRFCPFRNKKNLCLVGIDIQY